MVPTIDLVMSLLNDTTNAGNLRESNRDSEYDNI